MAVTTICTNKPKVRKKSRTLFFPIEGFKLSMLDYSEKFHNIPDEADIVRTEDQTSWTYKIVWTWYEVTFE